jgi:hypothetical protein
MQTLFTQYKNKTEGLNRLADQLATREQLLMRLRGCLPANTQQSLTGAQIVDDKLILITTSAAWATRLRLDAQKLLSAANDPTLRHYTIQVVAPHNEVSTQKHHTPDKPSDEALIALQALTHQLASDDILKDSMTRLLQVIRKASVND